MNASSLPTASAQPRHEAQASEQSDTGLQDPTVSTTGPSTPSEVSSPAFTAPGLNVASHHYHSNVPCQGPAREVDNSPSVDSASEETRDGADSALVSRAQLAEFVTSRKSLLKDNAELRATLGSMRSQLENSIMSFQDAQSKWEEKRIKSVEEALQVQKNDLVQSFTRFLAKTQDKWHTERLGLSKEINALNLHSSQLQRECEEHSQSELRWQEKVSALEGQVGILMTELDSAKELAAKAATFVSSNDSWNSYASKDQSAEPFAVADGTFYPFNYFNDNPQSKIPQGAQLGMFEPEAGFVPDASHKLLKDDVMELVTPGALDLHRRREYDSRFPDGESSLRSHPHMSLSRLTGPAASRHSLGPSGQWDPDHPTMPGVQAPIDLRSDHSYIPSSSRHPPHGYFGGIPQPAPVPRSAAMPTHSFVPRYAGTYGSQQLPANSGYGSNFSGPPMSFFNSFTLASPPLPHSSTMTCGYPSPYYVPPIMSHEQQLQAEAAATFAMTGPQMIDTMYNHLIQPQSTWNSPNYRTPSFVPVHGPAY